MNVVHRTLRAYSKNVAPTTAGLIERFNEWNGGKNGKRGGKTFEREKFEKCLFGYRNMERS